MTDPSEEPLLCAAAKAVGDCQGEVRLYAFTDEFGFEVTSVAPKALCKVHQKMAEDDYDPRHFEW